MAAQACNCGWEIKGIKHLPWHYHYYESHLRRISDGYEFTIVTDDSDPPGYDVLMREDCIRFAVSYKDLLRVLSVNRDSVIKSAAVLQSMLKDKK